MNPVDPTPGEEDVRAGVRFAVDEATARAQAMQPWADVKTRKALQRKVMAMARMAKLPDGRWLAVAHFAFRGHYHLVLAVREGQKAAALRFMDRLNRVWREYRDVTGVPETMPVEVHADDQKLAADYVTALMHAVDKIQAERAAPADGGGKASDGANPTLPGDAPGGADPG